MPGHARHSTPPVRLGGAVPAPDLIRTGNAGARSSEASGMMTRQCGKGIDIPAGKFHCHRTLVIVTLASMRVDATALFAVGVIYAAATNCTIAAATIVIAIIAAAAVSTAPLLCLGHRWPPPPFP